MTASRAVTHDAPGADALVDGAAILARLRAGDVAAFESIYRFYHPVLCGFVYGYVGTREEAEEVAQDVLCALWDRREQLVVRTTLAAYVYGAARYRALDALKRVRAADRRVRQVAMHITTEESVPGLGAPSAVVTEAGAGSDRGETIRLAVGRAIAALPEPRRAVLRLRWQHGLSYAEIAAVVGSSTKAVEVQLNRTLNALRRQLKALR